MLRLAILLCAAVSFSFQPGGGYTVKGKLDGAGDGMVYIMQYKGQGVYDYIDSASMRDGKFTMKGSVDYPRYVIFSINRNTPRLGFWIENSKIKIKADNERLNDAEIRGSATQKEYEETRKFLQPFDMKCRELAQQSNKLKEAGNLEAAKQADRSLESCWEEKVHATINYIKEHRSSYPAAALVKGISYALTWQELQDVINSLDPAIVKSGAMDEYLERIAILKEVDTGKKAPDFSQAGLNGQQVNLYNVLKRNKLVLIDFWAAWCGPCRRENPNIVSVYKDYHTKGFEVLAVSLDKAREPWLKAIKDDGLPWIHVSNLKYWDNPIVDMYGVSSVPANVLVDGNGVIVGRNLKGDDLRNAVKAVLENDRNKNGSAKLPDYSRLNIKGLPAKAQIASIVDIAGKEGNELVTGMDSLLTVYKIEKGQAKALFSLPLTDQILQLAAGDANNDGKNELVIATGNTRYAKGVDVNVYSITERNGKWDYQKIYNKASERPHTVFLDVVDANNDGSNEIVVSFFNSKYFVETVSLNQTGNNWNASVTANTRMGLSRAIGKLSDEKGNITIVGRPYGDSIGAAGDSYIEAESNEMLPSFRGVKQVVIGDADNDGKNEIYLSDGWHQDYGKIARGRIAEIEPAGEGFQYELIEDVKGQVEFNQVEIADINGDGKNELVTSGSKYFRVYSHNGEQWTAYTDTALKPAPFAVGDLDGDQQPEIAFAGSQGLQIFNFGNPQYTTQLGEEVRTEKIDPLSLIGKKAPELKVMQWFNADGIQPGVSKGKVVILDFWATWCIPCIRMFPLLKEWQQKYGDRGLQIIGITRLDGRQTLEEIEAFVAKEKFSYPIAVSEEAFNSLAYGVGPIPHLVLIDRNGVVRKFEIGTREGPELEKEIIKLLEESN